MHKNHRLVSAKDNVRFAWQVSSMQPKAHARRMQTTPQRDFRLRIPPADSSHHARAHDRVHNIDHFGLFLLSPTVLHLLRECKLAQTAFAIVDLFAGPGGLAEGFVPAGKTRARHPFRIALSVENEAAAHQTLLLRNFLRQFVDDFPDDYYRWLNGEIAEPDWRCLHPGQWRTAKIETLDLAIGERADNEEITRRIGGIREARHGDTVLIGGPPCQAYSLVGRARNSGNASYVASKDKRHHLYKEYVAILDRLRPAAFVMENVKGILSSTVDGQAIFRRILDDLRAAGDGYELVPLAGDDGGDPSDFVVRSEDFGIPQARHRVIVVGLRSDVARRNSGRLERLRLRRSETIVTVRQALSGLPPLRSGLSKEPDSATAWASVFRRSIARVRANPGGVPRNLRAGFVARLDDIADALDRSSRKLGRNGGRVSPLAADCPPDLRRWLTDDRLRRAANHESRSHIKEDLTRYLFAALYTELVGNSPKAVDFPSALAPDHANWRTGKFADRFRTQAANRPASTVTSHISKDGHYFIHADPRQCRSLTVREAARLQSFPDNYLFKGNRTQQYVQVGNAVPPFLASQIAEIVTSALAAQDIHASTNSKRGRAVSTGAATDIL